MDISEHFNILEPWDLMDPQVVYRIPFYKNEKNYQSGFIGIGLVDISEHFNMLESMDLMDLQIVHRMAFYKSE